MFGISSWVALPIKGERSELTRLLFPPLVFVPAPFSMANLDSDTSKILRCDRSDLMKLETSMGSRSPVCHLVRPFWGWPMCAPFGPGLCLQGYRLKGSYFSPSPGPALVGLASPGGFGSGSFRPWLASPGVSGVPSLFRPFCPLFCFSFVT